MALLTLARLAWLILAIVTMVVWLAALPGCSVDQSGLGSPELARGLSDSSPNDGTGGVIVRTEVMPDAFWEEAGGAINTDGGTIISDVGIQPSSDGGQLDVVPPSECPLELTRSLSSCSGAQTQALCHTYINAVPALQVGCTAEGYLCVPKCPL